MNPLPDREPRRLGDFEILREIGRGGMGIVYEARQISLGRQVALKVLPVNPDRDERWVERFRRESAAAARLQHPHIVPVHAVGEQDGIHYFAMEFLPGPSLQGFLKHVCNSAPTLATCDPTPTSGPDQATTVVYRRPVTSTLPQPNRPPLVMEDGRHYFDTVAAWLAEVADALEHAHRRGVIHRDIKPANLILASDGRLCVGDFGVARLLDQDAVTRTGEFMGTPAYTSPEQMAASTAAIDHRTDVYSLGATLYEMLTLVPPFSGESMEQIIARVLHADPVPPRRLNPAVPPALETICLKCLEKDPARRYPSARDLASDLRSFLARRPIQGRRTTPFARLRRWVGRHPALAVSSLLVVLAVLAAGFFAWQAWHIQRGRLEEQRQHATDSALLAVMSGDLDQAEERITEAERLGVSGPDLGLLRGLVAGFRGDTGRAREELTRVLGARPESVAALSLLAYYLGPGDEDYNPLMVKIERLPCQTQEDTLFKAMAQARRDPERGLATLDQAVRLRNTSVARLIRAEVAVRLASASGRVRDAENALQDAQVAAALAPDQIRTVSTRVHAEVVAAYVFRRAGDPGRAAELQRQAAEGAARLAAYGVHEEALLVRCIYHLSRGDEKAVLDLCADARRQAGRPFEHNRLRLLHATGLYLDGKLDEAWEVLGDEGGERQSDYGVLRVCILADEGEVGEARALAEQLWDRQKGLLDRLYVQTGFLLLGDLRRAEDLSRNTRKMQPDSPWRNGWYGQLLDHACGGVREEDLAARAGDSLYNQCEAHYFSGMRHLAQGHRDQARGSFRKASDLPFWTMFDHILSRVLLHRMEKDPKWPPWIR